MHISESSQNRGRAHARGFKLLRLVAACFLAGQLALLPLASAAGNTPSRSARVSKVPAPVAANDPVLQAMQTELARAITELGKAEQPPDRQPRRTGERRAAPGLPIGPRRKHGQRTQPEKDFDPGGGRCGRPKQRNRVHNIPQIFMTAGAAKCLSWLVESPGDPGCLNIPPGIRKSRRDRTATCASFGLCRDGISVDHRAFPSPREHPARIEALAFIGRPAFA